MLSHLPKTEKLILEHSINSSSLVDDQNVIQLNFCGWFDIFVQWQGMWVVTVKTSQDNLRKSNTQYRNIVINAFGLTFTIISIFVYCYLTIQDWNDSHKSELVIIISIVEVVCITIARVISLYYLLFHFYYPWYNITLPIHNINYKNDLQTYLDQQAKHLSNRLKLYLLCIYIFHSIHFICYQYEQEQTLRNWIDLLISVFGMYLPCWIFQPIFSFVVFKYRIKLYYLCYVLKYNINTKTTPDFLLILREYKSLKTQFKYDTRLWNIYMLFFATFFGAAMWNDANILLLGYLTKYTFPKHHWLVFVYLVAEIIAYVAPFVEFIICSCKINDQYNKLRKLLWEYDNNDNDITHDSNLHVKFGYNNILSSNQPNVSIRQLTTIVRNVKDYHFLLNYVQAHPIYVTLFGKQLSSLTVVYYVLAFSICKFISYAVYYFYH